MATRHRRRSFFSHPPPPLHQISTIDLLLLFDLTLPPLISSAVKSPPIHHAPPDQAKPVDIGARARQLQVRRLWTYALTFSCIAGFIVIVLNSFQYQLVFCVTRSDALEKYSTNPSKSKFRLGGLVLEGSVVAGHGVRHHRSHDRHPRTVLVPILREAVYGRGEEGGVDEERVREGEDGGSVTFRRCWRSTMRSICPGKLPRLWRRTRRFSLRRRRRLEAAGAESESKAGDGAVVKSS